MLLRRFAICAGALSLMSPLAAAQTLRPDAHIQVLQLGTIPEPLDVEFSQDGNMWISGRKGELFIIPAGTNDMRLVQMIAVDSSGERGLHGIQFHPDYPRTPYVYLYQARAGEEE